MQCNTTQQGSLKVASGQQVSSQSTTSNIAKVSACIQKGSVACGTSDLCCIPLHRTGVPTNSSSKIKKTQHCCLLHKEGKFQGANER